MTLTLQSAVSQFGKSAKAKLNNPAAKGEPEDQLRSPVEGLVKDMAELCGLARSSVTPVGETAIKDLKSRPDFAVTVQGALVGHIEIKAPGKGADPTRFKDPHDREQWERLRSLPNLMYTDGNGFSLWRSGEPVGAVETLIGDVETSGASLDAPPGLQAIFADFLGWEPIPPRDAKQLAATTARLCRLLRDEVAEQLTLGSPALTSLATSWRELLFPDADDAQFADGYAQAVTFGLLMARARAIPLVDDLEQVGRELGKTDTLVGTALRLLTDDVENQKVLETSLNALTRVLGAVDWKTISKGKPDAWLYFYEDFLEVYDNDLRKQTGSYYTPPKVVGPMVRLVDEVLQHEDRFNLSNGLASEQVKIVDPAVGTGTFPLGVLRQIAQDVEADKGGGAVSAEIQAAVGRLIGFEVQLGPFAVAQLRILAEIADLTEKANQLPLRMFVTDTLDNPYGEPPRLRGMEEKIAQSRRDANKVKRSETITVVIGNPPYLEEARGRGGWVESGAENSPEPAPLRAWFPPPEWRVGVHSRHLYNLYVYFLRWATWKVFDHDPNANTGVVCFITIASFLRGDGFQKVRDYFRRTAQDIWVIDCSPEGFRPDVNTRIFPGVSQQICILLASRPPGTDPDVPATVRYHALPRGPRNDKFADLEALSIDGKGWLECSSGWREPFSPKPTVEWSSYPALKSLFNYNGTGVMLGRTWVVAPDEGSLRKRWEALTHAAADRKEDLFFPHLRDEQPGDKHSKKVVQRGLPGYPPNRIPVADDQGPCVPPIRYGFRSFDRQWIIPDNRLINQPNPTLWAWYSEQQVYLTAPEDKRPTTGPALTFTGHLPDSHHYNGRGGRVFPLWSDREGRQPNMPSELLGILSERFGQAVGAVDLVAYIAAMAAHPAYAARFETDLKNNKGLRIPLTADADTFAEAAELGRRVIWLHTFGERFTDAKAGRPARPPRLPEAERPQVPKGGSIPEDPDAMPDTLEYDEARRRINVGGGYVTNVTPEMWGYQVSGVEVLPQWSSYRKKDRRRPLIGNQRPQSKLVNVQPDSWLAEYTTELLNLLNVIGLLVGLEPEQADLLERVCSGPMIAADELPASDSSQRTGAAEDDRPRLFD